MPKTLEYKRRLRRQQKARKRREASSKSEKFCDNTSNYDVDLNSKDLPTMEKSLSATETWVRQGQGATILDFPETINSFSQDQEQEVKPSECKKLEAAEKLCQKLGEKLEAHSHYYNRLLKDKEDQLRCVKKDCKRSISSIRSFWRDKIYREQTRPGQILKRSMELNKTMS